jgi:hypothetical protein
MALVLLASASLVSNAAGQSITGRVFERVGSRQVPLRKALVLAGSPDGQQTFAVTRTDSEGRYLLAGEVAGRVRLSASKFGYLLVTAGGKKQPELNINCLESACGPFDFELVKGGIVAGTVVDDLNELVQRAFVWALTPGSAATDASQSQGEGRTDDRGRFRIIGLAEGEYELHSAVGGRRGGDTTIRAGPVPVALAAGEEITGISLILDEDSGAAFTVSGRIAGVDLSPAGEHRLFMRPLERRLQAGPRFGSHIYRLGRDGVFAIEEVPPGEYVFTYMHHSRGGTLQRLSLGVVKVEGSMQGLTLQPHDPSGFRGRVESDGSELPNHVTIAFTRTDRRGGDRAEASFPGFAFSEADLLPGTYNLSLRRKNLYIKEVRIGDETVGPQGLVVQSGEIRDITLLVSSEFAVVRGRVKPSRERRVDEQTASHYRVGLEGPGGIVSVQTDQSGAFTFEKLIPGDYRICAWSDRTHADVGRDKLWEAAGDAVRSFPVDPGSEIEIELTAVE